MTNTLNVWYNGMCSTGFFIYALQCVSGKHQGTETSHWFIWSSRLFLFGLLALVL